MMKKLLTLFLALAASVGTLFAKTYSGTCGNNLTWTLSSGTLTISGTGAMKDYTFDFDTYRVYTPWYSYRSSIKNVIIEDGVTSIGKYAFYDCSMTSVTIPNSVTSIGQYAFQYCSLTSIEIPNSVTSIGTNAFYNCSSLASVTIGESVASIGDYAFRGCSKLATVIWNAKKIKDFSSSNTPFYFYDSNYSSSINNFDLRQQITSFTFGDKVEYIPAYLCSGMSNLTAITIPNSVTSIGIYAFKGCSKLATVIWNAKKINDFSSSNTPFYYYNSSSSSDNFALRQQITSFTFGDNVEYIPAYICSGMSNLTTITIPNSVTSIGEGAFYNCSGLASVTIGESVTSIGNYAFYDCSKLTSVTIPNSVTSIGDRAFCSCDNLASVTIGESVTSIGSSAFEYCSSLTSITVPNSVTSIGEGAFNGCKISKIYFSGTMEEWCTKSFFPYSISSSYTLYINGEAVSNAVIPNSVTSIGTYAFSNCRSLASITIPNSVTSIGNYAFYNCSKLTSVTIPNSVTSIGKGAFYNCSSLASITIGESVTSIGNYAFKGCSKLATVIWNAKKINDFSSSNTPFYYYNSSSISYNFDLRKQITSFTFGDNVESIPAYLCSGMSNLTTITIPNSVTSIGIYAFKGCSKLTTVIWNAKKINDFSSSNTPFYYYDSSSSSNNFDLRQQITSFTFGDNVESIPTYLCSGMSNLTTITIPNSVTSIGAYAFRDCSSLTSVNISDLTAWLNIIFGNAYSNPLYYAHNLYLNETLITDLIVPNSINSIESFAFYNCSSLTSITIPNSVTSIGKSAFNGCSSLTSVTIPNTVTSIGGYAFSGCTYLEDITIGSGINVDNGIGENAFNGCRYLLSVTCKAIYPPVINANVFEGCGVLGGVDLYVPEKSVVRYKKADVWSEFNIVGKDLSVDDPTNPTNPEDGKFTITWQDEDGNVIKTDEVAQGTTPAFTGMTPTKPATNEYTYEFAGWLPKIQPATKDMYYTTFFERNKIETPVYTVNINGENCSLNINNQYPEGTVITLEAVADECFEFRQWSDGNKDNPRTITVTANTNLTAEFNKVRYTVTGQTETATGGKVQIIKK